MKSRGDGAALALVLSWPDLNRQVTQQAGQSRFASSAWGKASYQSGERELSGVCGGLLTRGVVSPDFDL